MPLGLNTPIWLQTRASLTMKSVGVDSVSPEIAKALPLRVSQAIRRAFFQRYVEAIESWLKTSPFFFAAANKVPRTKLEKFANRSCGCLAHLLNLSLSLSPLCERNLHSRLRTQSICKRNHSDVESTPVEKCHAITRAPL